MNALDSLLNPPVLFFVLGAAATLLRSDLHFPDAISKFLSIYLLFAIGFHGGVELRENGISANAGLLLASATLFSAIAPLWVFRWLKRKLSIADAAAMAASYGSVSAVTFITAIGYLKSSTIDYDGFMVAALALMEFPAIATGVLLYRWHATSKSNTETSFKSLAHETLFNGAVFLLVGSLLIGWITGEQGWLNVKPFIHEPLKGMLCLFLLDMGIIAAKRLHDVKRHGVWLLSFALIGAVLHGMLGLGVSWLIGASMGNAILIAVLFGSASYIAVPAAMRMAIPDANSSVFLTSSMAITFPFNLTIGIPLYIYMAQIIWS